ncbi:MAG: tetratricopeptide repeat protein [Proteobacteria bacterium]|jgi:tetratricopeptide (TPR) repeat protein|nr:tetratricopeptide repeat protein [Pseudomonadota bacterium]MBK9251284.1 tetratricopeptide repeat protein [Pseudomonadota bacterium]MCC6632735.1 tetratricopeptide repeat protein [Gammaproteobacteria bacterium]
MQSTRLARNLAALLLLASGMASPLLRGQELSTTSTAPSEEQSEQLLVKALDAIHAGNPQTAIDQYLDPVIAEFERLARPDGPQLYSANTLGEVLFYSSLNAAAARKGQPPRDSEVVSGAWSAALHLKGYALIDLERYEDAKSTLRHGIEVAPLNPALWNELGAILQLEKNWPEAARAYEQAESGAKLFADPQGREVNALLTRALRGQGFVLIETGELKKAEKLYRRCLKLDPDDDVAKKELAYIAGLKSQKKKRPR